MSKYPSLPIWTDALIGDTYHLTPAEFGAYLRLLIAMWRSPGCRLQDDDAFLGRIIGAPKQWSRIRPALEGYLTRRDGFVTQKRLLDEYEFVSAKVKKAAAAGRASALKRKHRDETNVSSELEQDDDQVATPIPIPIPTNNNDRQDRSKALLERMCEILRVNLTDDPSRFNWSRSMEELVFDGFTDQQILEGIEIARKKGVPKMEYVQACVRSPPREAPAIQTNGNGRHWSHEPPVYVTTPSGRKVTQADYDLGVRLGVYPKEDGTFNEPNGTEEPSLREDPSTDENPIRPAAASEGGGRRRSP